MSHEKKLILLEFAVGLKSEVSALTINIQDKQETAPAPTETAPKAEEEEEIDIDLNDPEVNAAALKIQAGFKGHKTRRQVKELKVRSQTAHCGNSFWSSD